MSSQALALKARLLAAAGESCCASSPAVTPADTKSQPAGAFRTDRLVRTEELLIASSTDPEVNPERFGLFMYVYTYLPDDIFHVEYRYIFSYERKASKGQLQHRNYIPGKIFFRESYE